MRSKISSKIASLVLAWVVTTLFVMGACPSQTNAAGTVPAVKWIAKAYLGSQHKEQQCPPGHWSVAKKVIDGKVVETKVDPCPSDLSAGTEPRTAAVITKERRSWFRFGFGLNGYYMTTASPGPDVSGIEGEVYGQLMELFGLPLNFRFSLAPGKSEIDGSNPYSLAEYVGFQYQPSEQFSLALGGRHRVIFQQDEENVNALMAEAQLRFRIGGPLLLNLKGAVGSGWFPYMGPVKGYYPAGVEIPIEWKPGNETTKSIGLGLEIEF